MGDTVSAGHIREEMWQKGLHWQNTEDEIYGESSYIDDQ